VARLVDLGVDRPSLAGTLRGVVAQRLVRRLCPECSVAIGSEPTESERLLAERFGVQPSRRAAGCANCGQTGYLGRVPVTEVMVMGPDLADRIVRGAAATELEKAARASGMRTLRDSALARAARGETTLEEVERVLGERAAEAVPSPAPGGASAAPAATPALALVATSRPTRRRAASERRPSGDAAAPASADGEEHTRVLVVDDDPVHRNLACRALERAGFEVDEADSGAAALEKAGTGEPYSLIVTDLNMPGLGGREVVTCLRALPSTAGVSIMVATSEDGAATEAQLIEAGADDYIRKPLEPARFVARVRAALRRAAA